MVSMCSIMRGGIIRRGISYCNDDRADINRYNECLDVESDDRGLYLKSLGFGRQMMGVDNQRLTCEEAAEYYWSMLMERAEQ